MAFNDGSLNAVGNQLARGRHCYFLMICYFLICLDFKVEKGVKMFFYLNSLTFKTLSSEDKLVLYVLLEKLILFEIM